jgi:hypothetical protein
MAKLGKLYRNRTISRATLVTEDLLMTITDFLFEEIEMLEPMELGNFQIMGDWLQTYRKYYKGERNKTEVETDLSYMLNEDLFELMNEIAPEGCYFGSHEGDGSDFGFWESPDDETTITLREFNQKDWQNWMGCDGDSPKIGEIRIDNFDAEIVADVNGIGIQGYDMESDFENPREFTAYKICSSQEVAEEIIGDMHRSVAMDCLEMMGFVIDSDATIKRVKPVA